MAVPITQEVVVKRKYRQQNRGGQNQMGKRPRKSVNEKKRAQPTYEHSLYGAIPLIRVQGVDQAGNPYEYNDYDPDFQPQLPPGAVRGDVRKQEFCRMCHMPKYFYVDQEKVCVQCGSLFIFSGAEQKHWYEVLKFHFDSVAIRCVSCRKKRRSDRALRQQLAAAKAALREKPDDVTSLLSVAESIVRYHQRTGQGNLNEAVAAARKATKIDPSWRGISDALFWEGWCHALAGRIEKTQHLFNQFIEDAGKGARRAGFVKEAKAWLSEMRGT